MGSRICVSNNFLSDTDDAGPARDHTCRGTVLRSRGPKGRIIIVRNKTRLEQ